MQPTLQTNFLGLDLASPLVLPAGIMGLSYSGLAVAARKGAGMVTTKSFTLQPRTGHKGPVVAEWSGGMLNSMGLCNPGIEEGLKELHAFREVSTTPVIISVFGTSREEFVELARRTNRSTGNFLELNLSCPNVADEFGTPLSASQEEVSSIIYHVKKISRLPVIAKLSPNVYRIREIASAAEAAGADALSLINTLGPGMLIDRKMGKPILHNRFGGLSGPCIKPIALKLIYETYSAVSLPIIGMGGVLTGEDAIEMIMAGATLIGIGTGIYYRGIDIFNLVNEEIRRLLSNDGYDGIARIQRLEKLRE